MCQCLTGAYEVEHLQFGDNAESTSPTKQYNSTLKYKLYSFVYTIPKGTKKKHFVTICYIAMLDRFKAKYQELSAEIES